MCFVKGLANYTKYVLNIWDASEEGGVEAHLELYSSAHLH